MQVVKKIGVKFSSKKIFLFFYLTCFNLLILRNKRNKFIKIKSGITIESVKSDILLTIHR